MFKNKQTGFYYTELSLAGYGKVRRRSLGTKRKSDAKALEGAIREVHRRGLLDPRLFQLLDAVQGRGHGASGALAPEDLLVAVRDPEGADAGLGRLLRRLDDPELAKVIAAFLGEIEGEPGGEDATREDHIALPNVLRYADHLADERPVRLSFLTEAADVRRLLKAVERGGIEGDDPKLATSVVRYEKRAVSKLLTWRLGKAERDRVFAEVDYSGGDDRRRLREAVVTPAAIGRLCDELRAGYFKEGDEAAPLYVRLAVTTGATVRPLSETKNRQLRVLDSGAGLLHLSGTKKIKGRGNRDRDVTIPPQLMVDVLRFYREDRPEERIFPLDRTRFDTMFGKARKRAGLMEAVLDSKGKPTPIRPHDLRRIFAMAGERAGVSRTTIGHGGLGHEDLDRTDHYLGRETRVSDDEAATIADSFGW